MPPDIDTGSLQGRNTLSTNRQICARGVFRSQTPRAFRERLFDLSYIFFNEQVSPLIDAHKMLQRIGADDSLSPDL